MDGCFLSRVLILGDTPKSGYHTTFHFPLCSWQTNVIQGAVHLDAEEEKNMVQHLQEELIAVRLREAETISFIKELKTKIKELEDVRLLLLVAGLLWCHLVSRQLLLGTERPGGGGEGWGLRALEVGTESPGGGGGGLWGWGLRALEVGVGTESPGGGGGD